MCRCVYTYKDLQRAAQEREKSKDTETTQPQDTVKRLFTETKKVEGYVASWDTSWNRMMLITQAHNPAAAEDLTRTNSGLKSGSLRYSSLSTRTVASGMCSLSKFTSVCRKSSTCEDTWRAAVAWNPFVLQLTYINVLLTLLMMTLAAFQLRSLGTRPLGDSSTSTAANTLVTITGGFGNVRNSVRLSCKYIQQRTIVM